MKKIIGLLLALFISQVHAQPAPSLIPGCVYLSGTITLSNLQTTAWHCDINGKLITSSTGAPSGAAGGALSGTYPNPTLATAQPDVHTWAATQTFTVSPVFTDASGTRTALGLGTAATQNTGTSGSTLPFLNGINTWANQQTFTVSPVFTDASGTRTALGLGTAAVQNIGTSGANVPMLNASNSFSATQLISAVNVTGAITGATLGLGGATLGSNALAVTGNAAVSGAISIAAAGSVSAPSIVLSNIGANHGIYNASGAVGFSGAGVWSASIRPLNGEALAINTVAGTNGLSFLASPTGAPLATLSYAGTNKLQIGSTAFDAGGSLNLTNLTGTGTIIIGTADASTSAGGALQITGGASVAKRFWIPAITASAGLQTAVLCQSSSGEMIADSVACLASSARFKTIKGRMADGALARLMRLPIDRWAYNSEGIFHDALWTRERIGPIAEDVAAMDPRLAGYDADGKVRTYSTEQLLAFTIKAIQEQQQEFQSLKQRLN